MAMKRRDLLDASRLLTQHNLVRPGEMDTPALMLAVNYLNEKRDGETTLDFPEWLDQDFNEGDLDADKSATPKKGKGKAKSAEDPTDRS